MSDYKKAIHLLGEGEIDYRKICIKLAANHPALFVKYASEVDGKHVELCRDLFRNGAKIEAIKEWRNATGAGLKEAKEAVEAL